jgi:amino acid adenylation domain-containing protein
MQDDMVITIITQPDKVTLYLRYKTAVLSKEQAATVVATFEKALCSLLADSEGAIATMEVFSDHDKEIIWARNKVVPSPVESCVHDIIHQRCLERPIATAISAWDGEFSYQQLDELSSLLAQHLVARGVRPDEVVPLCLNKSRWTPLAMLGVMKAGGAFLLLDTSYPYQRLKDICDDVSCRLIVSSSAHAARSLDLAPKVVLVGDDCGRWKHEKIPNPIDMPQVRPDNALYVVFTSGSTGKPKGVVIEHRSYCSGARDHIQAYNLTTQSRVLQFSSFAFDISILEQLSVLMAGGCVCVISESQRKNNLGEAACALQANHAMLVPSVARLFRYEDLSTITNLSLAGECMNEADVNYWARRLRLMNGYGPAECSVLSLIQPSIQPNSDPQNIGYPVGSVAWVVDMLDHNKLVPYGAIGELVIEGPIVGRGYINYAQKSADVFIKPPTWLRSLREGQRQHTRLYKSGDLVRLNADGSLSILGRKDRQVKVRGQRLELGEVEAHVMQCFDCAQDVVAEMIVPSGATKSQLVALVSLKETDDKALNRTLFCDPSDDFKSKIVAADIKLRQVVPDFMVPSNFLPLAQFPRTASDKIDRNRLRDAVASMTLDQLQAYRASPACNSTRTLSSRAERELRQIWAQVLCLPPNTIGAEDNFFLRGGDSIDAMKAAALGRAAGLAVSVADIFAHPVLADLASLLSGQQAEISRESHRPFSLHKGCNPERLHVQLRDRGMIPPNSTLSDLLPATQAQDFFIQRGTFHSYNFFIKGLLDRDRLRAACDTLMSRHTILCTKFLQHDGRLMQMVLGNIGAQLREYTTETDLLAFYQSLWSNDLGEDDILGGLPVKFTLVMRSENEHLFTIQISHAQWDGVSIPRLFGDLAAIYNKVPLPPTSDFASYIYHRVSRNEELAFDFWREYLAGSSMSVPFPATCSADNEDFHTLWTFKGIAVPVLPAGITMATLVKAACGSYLTRLLSQNDVVFGHTVNGRSLSLDHIESLLGCCLNFIPIRVQLDPKWAVLDLLRHVQSQYTRALQYEHLELRDIFQNSTDWPAESQLTFIVQHQNIELSHSIPLNGLDVQYSKFARFDPLNEVWVFSEPHPDRLEIQICANSRVLSQAQAKSLCANLCDLIQRFSSFPDKQVTEILNS